MSYTEEISFDKLLHVFKYQAVKSILFEHLVINIFDHYTISKKAKTLHLQSHRFNVWSVSY